MALLEKERTQKEKVFSCDRCGKTKPFSLSFELARYRNGGSAWWHDEHNKCLCDNCRQEIIDAWYNQREVTDFELYGDALTAF